MQKKSVGAILKLYNPTLSLTSCRNYDTAQDSRPLNWDTNLRLLEQETEVTHLLATMYILKHIIT
jgi:hypothetical protein